MEENPFPDLSINCTTFLDDLSGRSQCSKCGKSRKYYCYTCYLPIPEIAHQVPKIQLPIKVDIIKHPSEVDGKSTAVHAGVIAPDDVTIYTYPVIPDYEDKSKVVLVFPGKDAVSLSDLAAKWNIKQQRTEVPGSKRKLDNSDDDISQTTTQDSVPEKMCKIDTSTTVDSSEQCTLKSVKGSVSDIPSRSDNAELSPLKTNASDSAAVLTEECKNQESDEQGQSDKGVIVQSQKECVEPGKITKVTRLDPNCPLERVVFVDSTWNQTKTICGDERLKGLTHIELQTRTTKFWRHQRDIPDTYLSTIEAIYYFLRDFHEHFVLSDYSGDYDNLLFFFKFMYSKIRTIYDGGKDLQAYKERTQKKGRQLREGVTCGICF